MEFGLQQRRADSSWGERLLPPRRFFPTTATVGRWLASSPLTSSDADVVVRIVARKAADGRVEFGLQQRRADSSWGERLLPPRRFFPTTATVGRWLASSPLTARAPQTATQSTQATGRDVLVGLLAALGTAAENPAGYDRGDYEHSSGELCDTSGTDPYTGLTFTAATCDVDHIVAAKEAHESGGHRWDRATRGRFGDDRLNLVASRDCVNRSKGSSDLAEWSGVQSGTCAGARLTAAGRCFWAARTVAVKYRYSLAVDTAERAELANALNQCPADIDATAPSRAAVTTAPTTETPSSTTATSNCHPAYDPCLPNLPGDALNCGDLTAAQKPVRVKQIGVDPYRLDRDRNGWGCTS
ncbi:MAG: hypothetical protein F4X49_12645 [Acidimicrobiia bacterium]|nr:hypothetical protein [Acidimicrobiia bacterium]